MVFSSHQLDLVQDLCEDITMIDQGRTVLQGEESGAARLLWPPSAQVARADGQPRLAAPLPGPDHRQ